MDIRETPRPKDRRSPEWDELTDRQKYLLQELLECADCIDFEMHDSREEMEILRDLGLVQLSYRLSNGMKRFLRDGPSSCS